MTDDEARTEIERDMARCAEQLGHGCSHCKALAHALTAIADRYALVRGYCITSTEWPSARDAAWRHIDGKP
jgi:hypothetical protein